jgi:hypothetical protein
MYYQLLVRDTDGQWRDEFGDKDRDAVDFERDVCGYKKKDTKIIRFARVPSQKQVIATIKELNA